MMERQRFGIERTVLEIETVLGEIRSLERRDRSRLTREDCRRLDLLLERKRAQLRQLQARIAGPARISRSA